MEDDVDVSFDGVTTGVSVAVGVVEAPGADVSTGFVAVGLGEEVVMEVASEAAGGGTGVAVGVDVVSVVGVALASVAAIVAVVLDPPHAIASAIKMILTPERI